MMFIYTRVFDIFYFEHKQSHLDDVFNAILYITPFYNTNFQDKLLTSSKFNINANKSHINNGTK